VTPGWYIAIPSHELRKGQVRPIVIAERELVVVRTMSGTVTIFDRYCPHLGASLALGKVVGEQLRCAFHVWEYNPDGKCVRIPQCAKIPARARVRSYPTVERFGAVWIFVGDDVYCQLPSENELLPGGGWVGPGPTRVGAYRTTCRDILENAVDWAHQMPVHGMNSLEIAHTFDEQKNIFVVRQVTEAPTVLRFFGFRKGQMTIHVYGPSVHFNVFDFGLGGEVRSCAYAQPVGPTETHLFLNTYVKGKIPWLGWITSRIILRMGRMAGEGDFRIWGNKIVVENPVLCEADRGPIMAYRRWFNQLGRKASDPASESGGEPRVAMDRDRMEAK
jgi:3-ketosteroid 9alpha-monooxygenase subunit A